MELQMRMTRLATTAILGLFFCVGGHAAPNDQITQLPYPSEVSLVQEPMGWTYRQSAGNLPLYLYEPASPDESVCDSRCEKQWAPLLVTGQGKPIGNWSIFVRKDGRQQWAFEQHPVYTYRRDTPTHAAEGRVGGAWHSMPHYPS